MHNSVQHTPIELPILNRTEATAIRLNIDRRPVTVISIYNPPGNIDIDDIELLQIPGPVIMAGDFNAKHRSWNCRQENGAGRKLCDYFTQRNDNFQILAPDTPTTVPDNPRASPDILNIALIKDIHLTTQIDALNELSSDHLPIQVTLIGHLTENIPRTILNYQHANWQQFRTDIDSKIPDNTISTPEDIDNGVRNITNIIQSSIVANIPKKIT